MKARLLLLPFGTAALALAGACSNPNSPASTKQNIADTNQVFFITGAPLSGLTAIDASFPRPMRAEFLPGYRWDVVFDLVNGQAVALPPAAVSIYGTAGFRVDSTPYDQILNAPTTGYRDSLIIHVQAGSVFLVQTLTYETDCVNQTAVSNRYLYSKIMVDSIHYQPFDPITAPNGGLVYYHMLVDPNCGNTALNYGYPTG